MSHEIKSINLPSKNADKTQFSEFFDIEELQTMQNLFSDAAGVASIITNMDGTPITKPSNFCRLCENIVRKSEKGCANCIKSDATMPLHHGTTPVIRLCGSAGLWETSASIKVNDTVVAHWLIGQVRNEEIDENRIVGYAQEIGVDIEEYKIAFAEVPTMSKTQFQKVARMLLVMVEQLTYKGTTHLQLKNKMAELEQANQLSHKNEESLAITLQSIGDGVISTDTNGLVVNMNPIAEKICGWQNSEAVGKPLHEIFNIINASTKQPIENPIDKVIATGKIIELSNHTILVSKAGREYQIADSAAPIINKQGIIIGVVLVFSDVTEKYAIEAELKESERSKAVLLSNLPGMAYRCKFNKDWTMEYASDGCYALTGYLPNQLLNNNTITFNEIINSEYHEYLWEIWTDAVKNNTKVCVEYKITTSDKQDKWVWEQGVPIFNNDGEIIALEGFITDITDKKNNEELLKKERSLLRSLIDNIPETIFAKDLFSRKTLSNKAEQKLKGYNNESDIIGKDDTYFFPKEYADKYMADDQIIFSTGQSRLNYEEAVIEYNGNVKYVLTSKIPLFDENNNVTGLIGISRDITEQKKAEEALINEKLLLKTIIDNIPDSIYSKDLEGRKTLANKAELELIGLKDESEVLGKDDSGFFHDQLAAIFAADDKRVIETGESMLFKEECIVTINGIEKWILSSKVPLRNKDNTIIGLVGISHDITENKKLEKKLQDERLLLRTVIDNIPDPIYVKDLEGRKTLANPAELKLLGLTSEAEVIGKTDFDFYPKEVAIEYWYDDMVVLKDEQSILHREGQLIDPTGRVLWTSGSKIPLRDNNNQLVGLLGISRDISVRKKALDALQESENFLKQTQTIANLGTYKLDINTGAWECSELLNGILGIEHDYEKTIESWEALIHPDFRKEMHEYFLNDVLIDKNRFDKNYKIIRNNDNVECWVHGVGELELNEKGEPVKMIGTIQDITKRKILAEKLRKSEAMYRSTLNASPDIIAAVDLEGNVTMISPAAYTIYGTENEKDIIGQHFTHFLERDNINKAKSNFETAFTEQIGAVEFQLKIADGSRIDVEIKGDIIRDIYGNPTGMVIIIRDIADRKKWEGELRNTQEQLKKFAAHLQNVREEERLEIARELHDELGQILIALKIDMGLLKQKVLKCSESKDTKDILIKFDDLLMLVDSTINTTRKIMTDLRPEVLFLLGYIEAAKLLVNKFEERFGIKCIFESELTNVNLTEQQSVALYRLLQEALTNIAKHASASLVKVQLIHKSNKLVLKIVDNGIGFDNKKISKNDSYGLLGMKERTFLLDGEFSIFGTKNIGTTIEVEIPYIDFLAKDNQLEFDY